MSTRTNLVKDPRCTDRNYWRAPGDWEAVFEDGEPAIRVTENATAGSLYIDPNQNFDCAKLGITPGTVLRLQVQVKVLQPMPVRVRIGTYEGAQGDSEGWYFDQIPDDGWVTHRSTFTATATPEGSYLRALVWPNVNNLPIGHGFCVRRYLLEIGTDGPYFDGNSQRQTAPEGAWMDYEWTGPADASPSVQTDSAVHEWTKRWWESLPPAYQTVDAAQNPEIGGYPLLRWLDGIGQIGGRMREISDGLYDGIYTNPHTAPDSALRWLAMMLGMSESQRNQPPARLRQRLITLTTIGRSAVGSRAMIGESAKPYLAPGAQVRVAPSSARKHTLILYIRAFDIPDDNTERVKAEVREAGFIPAGHAIDIIPVRSTWDLWEKEGGKTWDDKEANIKTWNDSDSAGIVLE